MDNINLMLYWLNTANEDYETMKVLYENKRYTWSLFVGHLVIEKLLKGIYAKNNKEEPYTVKSHNLLLLSEKCNIDLTDDQLEKLQIITQFNISARYDDYIESFKQKCTEEYTNEQIKNIEEVRIWLLEILMKE